MTFIKISESDPDSATENSRAGSVTATVKGFVKKHRATIVGVALGAAALGTALLMHDSEGQSDTDDEFNGLGWNLEPDSRHSAHEEFDAPESALGPDQQRQPVPLHSVKGHLMKTIGQPSERARENYAAAFEAGLVDSEGIPPGRTWRNDHERGFHTA